MEETDPGVAGDIAYRRRCLTVNAGIYARRYGPAALARLPEGSAVRRRYAAELGWMGSESGWTSQDERRIATLCAELLRHAYRAPEPLEHWRWHAARLRELLRQYGALVAGRERTEPRRHLALARLSGAADEGRPPPRTTAAPLILLRPDVRADLTRRAVRRPQGGSTSCNS